MVQDDNQGAKVSIIGASGGIGQPLSLLMKMNNYVDSLSLYDRHHPPGVAVDLSHINTPCSVVGYRGESNLPTVLTGSDIVIITAGVPRKPGMNRDDLFVYNARVVSQLAEACSHYCPDAFILLLTNPINSLLPLFSEIYRRKGVDGSRRLFGVTILDSIRASTFVSGALHLPPDLCSVPVIGGHAGATIVPLLSQLRREEYEQLNVPVVTKRIQFGGDEVVCCEGRERLCHALHGLRNCDIHRLFAACFGRRKRSCRACVHSAGLPKLSLLFVTSASGKEGS